MRDVPEDWRKAHDTSIFKKGKKEDLGKCRFVSFPSFPERVIEQLILETIFRQENYLE